MPSRKREAELFEAAWARIAPLLPAKPAHPKGGRPLIDDRACFEGIVYVLRNGIFWNSIGDGTGSNGRSPGCTASAAS